MTKKSKGEKIEMAIEITTNRLKYYGKSKYRDLRNCRCCLATYEKPTDFWCVLPLRDSQGKIVKPVGFCEFCDRSNEKWYVETKRCHYKEN